MVVTVFAEAESASHKNWFEWGVVILPLMFFHSLAMEWLSVRQRTYVNIQCETRMTV